MFFRYLVAVILFSCSWQSFALPQVIIEDENGHYWQLPVASEPATREQGLMYRPWLAPWQGMLFIFPQPQNMVFWMKNTLVPLDIRFYHPSGKLIARYPNAQPCLNDPCPLYSSDGYASYVLETHHYSWIGKHIVRLWLPRKFEIK